jgi:hypothetical protein|tara:strand:- start:119 stop:316 length:198 start_codon:yes stop_codon:yes gene_type:complete
MDAVNLSTYIFKKLQKFEEGHIEYLTGGNIKTMEDYKFVMGELSMLRTLREELKEALRTEGDPDE